jgi:hypothetical protein
LRAAAVASGEVAPYRRFYVKTQLSLLSVAVLALVPVSARAQLAYTSASRLVHGAARGSSGPDDRSLRFIGTGTWNQELVVHAEHSTYANQVIEGRTAFSSELGTETIRLDAVASAAFSGTQIAGAGVQIADGVTAEFTLSSGCEFTFAATTTGFGDWMAFRLGDLTPGGAVYFSSFSPAGTGWLAPGAYRLEATWRLDAYMQEYLPGQVDQATGSFVIVFRSAAGPRCGSADVGGQGGVGGYDGVLDNNDFVVFIDLFFGTDPLADVGGVGGAEGGDGVFDNNDFVVFIDRFFAGCG